MDKSQKYSIENIQGFFDNCHNNVQCLSLRNHQKEGLVHMLNGHDLLMITPTNSGKTLPMVFKTAIEAKEKNTKQVCIIVSPLEALIEDAITRLSAWGFCGVHLTPSMIEKEEDKDNAAKGFIESTFAELSEGTPMFILCSPEILRHESVKPLLLSLPVSQIQVDEVHCTASWGKDFRTDFAVLHEVRDYLPSSPMGLFSATLTTKMCKTVMTATGVKSKTLKVIKMSPDRPEIFLDLQQRKTMDISLSFLVDELNNTPTPDNKTLVFLNSIDKTSQANFEFRRLLTDYGRLRGREGLQYKSQHFSACMGKTTKDAILKDFCSLSYLLVLFSTIAYGMGLDNKKIRNVIVWDSDYDFTSLWQKISRACRDGKPGVGIIFSRNSGTGKSYLTKERCIREQILEGLEGYSVHKKECCGSRHVCEKFSCCSSCRDTCSCAM